MKVSLGKSKSGLPTVTENGGGASNTGSAQIVAGADGEAVKPLFVPKGYCNGEHAIFVAKSGMHIIKASHSRRGEQVSAYRIISITDNEADCEVVGEYENGDGNIPAFLNAAVDAALDKSHDYHCRRVHYIGT